MLFKGQSHVGITVKNLDKSLYFYHDVLGLEFSQEPSGWNDEPWLGKAVGVPGGVLRQTCLRLGDTLIELLEYKAPKSDTEAPMPSNNVGASHIGFEVADIVQRDELAVGRQVVAHDGSAAIRSAAWSAVSSGEALSST